MKTRLLLLSMCIAARTFAQGLLPLGAESAGLAHASLTDFNAFSPFHNPGLVASKKGWAIGTNYQNTFALQEFQTQAISVLHSGDKVAFSLSHAVYGKDNYKEMLTGIGCALRLSPQLSAGIKMDYFILQLPEYYGATDAVSASLGLCYKLNEYWTIASSFYNLNQAIISNFENDRLSPRLRMGACFSPSNATSIRAEIWKEPSTDLALKFGADYRVSSSFVLRGGLDVLQKQLSFGVGTGIKNWRLDLASQFHPRLGWTPVVSFSFQNNR